MAKCFSFAASRDWWYRYSFTSAGLRSVLTDLGEGTVMHCWVPKCHRQTKPNLVLVHGFGANAMWQYGYLLRHFIQRFNIYVPDLLFFGRSFTTRPERTEAFQAECVMKMMETHGVRKMNLVGVSYGGFVGYNMAVQFPEAMERLVLCCTGVCLEEKDMEQSLFAVSDLEEAASTLMPQTPEKLRELMKLSFVKPVKGVPNYFLTDFIDRTAQMILKDRKLINLPKITRMGDQDQIFPIELAHLGENAKLVVIKNTGHAVNLRSREFAKHLKSFLIDSSHRLLPRTIVYIEIIPH
ncbi:hypothetical protein AAG906_039947 [Vitis piasezkii]